MHDRKAARVIEPFGDLGDELGDRVQGQSLALLEDLLQRTALEKLHCDVGDAVLLADVVDRDQARVV